MLQGLFNITLATFSNIKLFLHPCGFWHNVVQVGNGEVIVKSKVLLALAPILLFSLPAYSKCLVARGPGFFVDQNDSVTYHEEASGKGCWNLFRAGGQVTFTVASVAGNPASGKLTQTGPMSFHYQPNPSFKGNDRYKIKVCGRSPAGSGCSTLTYEAMVD